MGLAYKVLEIFIYWLTTIQQTYVYLKHNIQSKSLINTFKCFIEKNNKVSKNIFSGLLKELELF